MLGSHATSRYLYNLPVLIPWYLVLPWYLVATIHYACKQEAADCILGCLLLFVPSWCCHSGHWCCCHSRHCATIINGSTATIDNSGTNTNDSGGSAAIVVGCDAVVIGATAVIVGAAVVIVGGTTTNDNGGLWLLSLVFPR